MGCSAILLPARARVEISSLVRRAWAFNRLVTLAGLLHLALIPLFVVAWLVDPRAILGQPAWIKPLKFAISGGIYLFTFLWLLSYVRGFPRIKQFAAGAAGVALLAETGLITMQVVRGTTSHFNVSSAFDGAVFGVMGGFIVMVATLNLLLGIALFFQRLPDPVFAWGLRWGVLISFVGMAIAFLMTSGPTPQQQARMEAGEPATAIGAHAVGVEDGGPGLPFVGWSTEGGDLRAPHFVGLHGMQALPLVGWLLGWPAIRRRLSTGHRVVLVSLWGVGYLALTLLLTWQALRGQSIIAPDGATWAALLGLMGSFILGVGLILAHGLAIAPGRRSLGFGPRNMPPFDMQHARALYPKQRKQHQN
ncbi:MAG: hypothetical protein KJZ93_08940 [Caldilineaceae bacterium]|nr:hypothetical protein [Caldilineaceae bacterium]